VPSGTRSVCGRRHCRDSLRRLAHFGEWQLDTIRASDVEDHVFTVAQQAPRAAELMLDTLKMILRSANERGQTIDEDVLRVRPPRRERVEMRFLDWSEVEQLAYETVEPYGNLVRFACLTGMRQGEVFGLRDRALDFARDTVVEAGARDGKLVPTKTTAGRRQVRLSGEARRVLREQLLARAPNELGLVFPTPGGTVWRKDNFMSRVFRPAVRRANLAPLRFHDLRHTYAALMVAAGAHPMLLQAQLDHTSTNVTLNTYGHLFPDALADVGEALDRAGDAPANRRPSTLKFREIIKLIEDDGCRLVAQRGSHRQYEHPMKPGKVTVAGQPNADVPRGTAANILRQAGLQRPRK
jgi:integrase/predicted RNA binding protein YcfA (HicA-like mRNA interferase family)